MKAPFQLVHHGYAIIRRPFISTNAVAAMHAALDAAADLSTAQKIDLLFAKENVALALSLSAPGLHARARARLKAEGADAELVSLQKYLIRMGTRCTPFGVFANVGLANVVDVDPGDAAVPAPLCRVRLDSGVLVTLHELIRRAIPFDRACVVKKNPLSYAIGDELRYIERRFAKGSYHFSLARITLTGEVQALLKCLDQPQSVAALAMQLQRHDASIASAEAEAFIGELLGAGIIDIDLDLSLIGPDPLGAYLRRLHAFPGTVPGEPRALLAELHQLLMQKDEYALEETVSLVARVEARLQEAKLGCPRGGAVHIDSFAPAQDIRLPDALLPELQATLAALHHLFPPAGNERMSAFAQAYERRFGDQLNPLGTVLDPELGIPYGFSSAVIPWMQGLNPLMPRTEPRRAAAVEQLLADMLSSQQSEIDLRALSAGHAAGLPPDIALSANLTVYREAGQERDAAAAPLAFLHYFSSPGSANLSARFAARHPEMTERVRASLARDEALEPDVVYAEIVHTPNSRTGNVLARPALLKHRIVLTGDASDGDAGNIYIDDLYIGVSMGRPFLRSKKLNCEVVPRMTSAFNFHGTGNLAIFQFLCALGRQASAPAFRWPPVCDHAAYLPRVRCGRLVLAAARWRLSRRDNDALCSYIVHHERAALDAYLAQRGIPRYFTFDEGDQKLEFDAHSMASLRVLMALIKSKGVVYLRESIIRMGVPFFSNGQETFHSELTLPLTFSRQHSVGATVPLARVPQLIPPSSEPASAGEPLEWFYMKVYGGEEYLKKLLVTQFWPMVENLVTQGRVQKWHFLRYRDPDFHFRIRLLGPANSIRMDANRCIHDIFDPKVLTQQLANVVVDRYIAEKIRYGGDLHLPHVETLFSADARYACRLMQIADMSRSDETVWHGVLLGTIQYMTFFLPDPRALQDFATAERDRYKSELLIDAPAFDRLGKKYRQHRQFVEAAVAGAHVQDESLRSALASRAAALEAYGRCLESLLGSGWRATLPLSAVAGIIHMQANRLFTSSSRPQEFVIFEFLSRAYRSAAARIR